MYGDFTRDPLGHAPEALYTFSQQGRVHLDSDWNELATGLVEALRTTVDDMLGGSAAINAGFAPATVADPQPGTLTFTKGTYFVAGYRIRVSDDVRLDTQPMLFEKKWDGDIKGTLAYLDVWIRNVSYLRWPDVRESALRGPDTTTRGVLTWQLGTKPLADVGSPADENAVRKDWDTIAEAIRSRTRGELWVHVDDAPTVEPCLDDGPGGYTGPGNHLYRFEIDGRTRNVDGVWSPWRVRWSRDNASVEWGVVSVERDGARIVTRPGFRPAPDQYVELVDEESELTGVPRPAYRVRSFDADQDHVSVETTVDWPQWDAAEVGRRSARLRLWDGVAAIPDDDKKPVTIERGIQVNFRKAAQDDAYRTGDYWLAPARSNGTLIWPDVREFPWVTAAAKDFVGPSGPIHHLAPVAFIPPGNGKATDARWTVELTRKP